MTIGKDKTRFEVAVTHQEKALLEQYCASVGRTKTDVLREFIRSLGEQKLTNTEDVLWDGWVTEKWDTGGVYHSVRYKHLKCCVYEERNNYEIWAEGMLQQQLPRATPITKVLLQAQAILLHLAELE